MVEAFEINKLKTSFSELNFEKLEQFNKSLFKNYLENTPNVLLKEMSEHLTEKLGHVPVSDKVLLKIVELERINKVSDLTTNPDLQFIWQRSKICAFFSSSQSLRLRVLSQADTIIIRTVALFKT